LSYLEYREAVEDLKNVGAVVIPHDRGCVTNGDPQVLKTYEGTKDDLDLAQWDLENSEKDSSDWIEASEAVENFKKELEDIGRASCREREEKEERGGTERIRMRDRKVD